MNPFQPFFDAQGWVLLDGGLATALEAAGHDLDDPLWSARVLLDDPEAVRAVHAAYLEAGADCIATVTYQATLAGLRARGLARPDAEAAIGRAVDLAVEVRDAFWADPENREGRIRPLVAASVGPYGAYLADGSEYRGDYGLRRAELEDFHRRRWEILAASSAELMACETIPSAPEVEALLGLLAETPGRWAWISLQCRDAAHLADGTPLSELVPVLTGVERLAAVGVNCIAPELAAPIVRTLCGTGAPVAVYPNSGERYRAEGKRWEGDADPSTPAGALPGWIEAGARVVGGCCRVGPVEIGLMRTGALALLPSREDG